MATTRTIQKVSRYGGAKSNLFFLPVAATQTLYVGEAIYLDSSGRVTIVADSGQAFAGWMAQDSVLAATDTLVCVDLAPSSDLFEGNVYHATAASAVLPDSGVLYNGATAGIKTVSGKAVVALDASSNKTIKIIARKPDQGATDIYPRCIFKVISTYNQNDLA
jgi:hypothetical protein